MVVISPDRPCYRVLSEAGFFGPDCHLYLSGAVIYYEDEPNEDMEPLNDKARERLRVYLAKLDALGEAAAKANNKAYIGRPRTLDDALVFASETARRIQLKDGDGGIPLMGAHPKGPKRIEQIIEEAEVPQDGRMGKLSPRPPNAPPARVGGLSVGS